MAETIPGRGDIYKPSLPPAAGRTVCPLFGLLIMKGFTAHSSKCYFLIKPDRASTKVESWPDRVVTHGSYFFQVPELLYFHYW